MKKYKKLAIAMPSAGILATRVFWGPTLSFSDRRLLPQKCKGVKHQF